MTDYETMKRVNGEEDGHEGNFFTGLMIALPAGIVIWVGVLALIRWLMVRQ